MSVRKQSTIKPQPQANQGANHQSFTNHKAFNSIDPFAEFDEHNSTFQRNKVIETRTTNRDQKDMTPRELVAKMSRVRTKEEEMQEADDLDQKIQEYERDQMLKASQNVPSKNQDDKAKVQQPKEQRLVYQEKVGNLSLMQPQTTSGKTILKTQMPKKTVEQFEFEADFENSFNGHVNHTSNLLTRAGDQTQMRQSKQMQQSQESDDLLDFDDFQTTQQNMTSQKKVSFGDSGLSQKEGDGTLKGQERLSTIIQPKSVQSIKEIEKSKKSETSEVQFSCQTQRNGDEQDIEDDVEVVVPERTFMLIRKGNWLKATLSGKTDGQPSYVSFDSTVYDGPELITLLRSLSMAGGIKMTSDNVNMNVTREHLPWMQTFLSSAL